MLQFGGKGPCGHWNYTFFLELVQACDFFGRKIKIGLKHTLSTAVERDNPTRLLSPFMTRTAGLILRASRASSFHLLLDHSHRCICFSLIPHCRNASFPHLRQSSFQNCAKRRWGKTQKNRSVQILYPAKKFFFWKTEKKKAGKSAPDKRITKLPQQNSTSKNCRQIDRFSITSRVFFQTIIVEERICKQVQKCGHQNCTRAWRSLPERAPL